LNPALSLAATLGGRLAAASFLAYVAAQLLGAFAGATISGLTVPGARLFDTSRAVGCLAHPSTRGSYGANWWRLFAWEGVSSAAASLALLSHSSPAFVALAFASVGAAAAVATAGSDASSSPLGDVVGNPALVLGPAVSFGCGWRAAPARWAGQAIGATVAAALAAAVLPPPSRVRVAGAPSPTATTTAAVPQTTTTTSGTRRGGGFMQPPPLSAEPGSSAVREPLLPTAAGMTAAPGGDV